MPKNMKKCLYLYMATADDIVFILSASELKDIDSLIEKEGVNISSLKYKYIGKSKHSEKTPRIILKADKKENIDYIIQYFGKEELT